MLVQGASACSGPVVIFQLPQMLRPARVQPAVLRLAVVERSVTDPMFPAQIRCLYKSLMLLQDLDDPLLCTGSRSSLSLFHIDPKPKN